MIPESNLVLRCDAGPTIGAGHVSRCLSLAERWRHGAVHVVGVGVTDRHLERLGGARVEQHDPAGLRDVVDARTTLVVDGYHLAATLTEASEFSVSIDDFGIAGRRAGVDVVVDQSLGSSAPLPVEYRDAPRVLRGARYVMQARSFDRQRPARSRSRLRLAVVVGGRPSTEVLDWASAVLSSMRTTMDPRWLVDVRDPAMFLSSCDAALSLAGSTTWELCRLGVPSVFVSASANQDAMLDRIENEGVGISLGHFTDVEPAVAAQAVDSLLADEAARSSIRSRGQALIDGSGARRVAAALRSSFLDVRSATAWDRDLYLRWANDPDTRDASFSRSLIAPKAHYEWFARRLADDSCHLLIVSDAGIDLGPFRVERQDGRGSVSVSVDERVRGRGMGAPLIDAASRWAFRVDPQLAVLDATIKRSNDASRRAFEAADYDLQSDGVSDGIEWVTLSRPRCPERDGPTSRHKEQAS